jgi:hypothetical protein
MNHSTGKPTKAEQLRLDRIHAMPCIACEMEADWSKVRKEIPMNQPLPTEAHHLVDKGTRKHSGGHDATIPLCRWHHRGEIIYPLSGREMRQLHGPSFALSKKVFIALYGSERDLLAIIDKRLLERNAA